LYGLICASPGFSHELVRRADAWIGVSANQAIPMSVMAAVFLIFANTLISLKQKPSKSEDW
jgi:hypothetical protein